MSQAPFVWVESSGGPLIVIPSSAAKLWRGTSGKPSDYERACAVADELGLIEVAGTQVLVLGDEPHRTTVVERDTTHLIVRWIASSSEGHILAALSDVAAIEFGPPSLQFFVSEREAILMDAADKAGDVRGKTLPIHLRPGTYVVDSAYRRTPDCHILLHRMTPVQ